MEAEDGAGGGEQGTGCRRGGDGGRGRTPPSRSSGLHRLAGVCTWRICGWTASEASRWSAQVMMDGEERAWREGRRPQLQI